MMHPMDAKVLALTLEQCFPPGVAQKIEGTTLRGARFSSKKDGVPSIGEGGGQASRVHGFRDPLKQKLESYAPPRVYGGLLQQ